MGPRVTDAEIADRVQEIVLRLVETDDLAIPPVPAVVSRCLVALEDPSASLGSVARVIETDPIVAAQIVRLANVAARAPKSPVRSITESVTRLGAAHLRAFLIETSARRVFESTDRQIAEMCRRLWEHSLAVAILAEELVGRVARSTDRTAEAYLGGLLHDIGKPVIAAMLLDAERRLKGTRTVSWLVPAAWIRLIARCHRRVGVALADKWGLPESVRAGIRDCGEYGGGEPHSLANAVRLANAITKAQDIYAGEIDRGETASLILGGRLLFALDDADVQKMASGLQERINQRLS